MHGNGRHAHIGRFHQEAAGRVQACLQQHLARAEVKDALEQMLDPVQRQASRARPVAQMQRLVKVTPNLLGQLGDLAVDRVALVGPTQVA